MLIIQFFLLSLTCSLVVDALCSNGKRGKCKCDYSSAGGYELKCPKIRNYKLLIDVKQGEGGNQVTITCRSQVTYVDMLEYLDDLSLGATTSVEFVSCPVPEDSFSDLLTSRLGTEGVLRLSFRDSQVSRALEAFHFQNLTEIIHLSLERCDLGSIDKTYFEDMDSLKFLDLTGNKNLRLHPHTFHNLTHLKQLNLADCNLSELSGDQFSGLSNLVILHLGYNQLRVIPQGIFPQLTSLSRLFLGNNRLVSLPQGVFDGLQNLTVVDIGGNFLSSLPQKLFAENPLVTEFEWSTYTNWDDSARVNLTREVFTNASLKSIKLLHVPLLDIPEDLFYDMESLESIKIQNAKLSQLPAQLFQKTRNLISIDFSGNMIRKLDENIFSKLTNLKTLRLKKNHLTEIGENLLQDLLHLEVLHLNLNYIYRINQHAFRALDKLKDLDLSVNSLTYDTNSQWFPDKLESLETLNLANNSFSQLPQSVQNNFLKLKKLLLAFNSFQVFNLEHFTFLGSLEQGRLLVDLSNNHISTFMLDVNPHIETILRNKAPYDLVIDGNPINCDCFATELKQILEKTVKNILTESIRVTTTDLRCSNSLSLKSVAYRDLNCHFPSDQLREQCLSGCGCSWNKYYQESVVNCSSRGLTVLPPHLPRIATSTIRLDLTNNRIGNLTTILDPVSSNYQFVTELILTGNRLTKIQPEELPPNLTKLAVDSNSIEEIGPSDLDYLESQIVARDLKVKLGENPLYCSCALKPLYFFLKNRRSAVDDVDQLITDCGGDETQLVLYVSEVEDFCFVLPSKSVITIVLVLVSFLLAIIALLTFYLCHKETVIVWVYSKPWARILFSEDIIDSDKPYDAFISFSHHDEEFVKKTLLEGLERPKNPEYKYKCLVHDRDWKVGEMIPDQIVNSVQSSRRTIIVLTKDYIESTWTKLEFRAAHTQALEDRAQRVILIVLGDLPPSNKMDEDLKKYISLNTYLSAEDPWFWQKLWYAMPHRGAGGWRKRNRRRSRKTTDQYALMRAQAEQELERSRTPSPSTVAQIEIPIIQPLHDHLHQPSVASVISPGQPSVVAGWSDQQQEEEVGNSSKLLQTGRAVREIIRGE